MTVNNAIISLTTHGDRSPLVWKVIPHLVEIAMPLGCTIEITVPSCDMESMMTAIPEKCAQYVNSGIVSVFSEKTDYGSGMKYMSAKLRHPNSVVVAVDDDMIYGENFLKELLGFNAKHPEAVLCRRFTILKWTGPKSLMKSVFYSNDVKQEHRYPILECKNLSEEREVQDGFPVNALGLLLPACYKVTQDDIDEAMKRAPHDDDVFAHILALRQGLKTMIIPSVPDAVSFVRGEVYERTALIRNGGWGERQHVTLCSFVDELVADRRSEVCVALVVYKERLTDVETLALAQMANVYRNSHDYVLVVRDDVNDLSAFTSVLGRCVVRRVPYEKLQSAEAYNTFCMTPEFYDLFSDYGYVAIVQLDGWVFYDALDWWASRGYDYVGGPWFYGPRYTFNHVQGKRVGGNGGMTLRKVSSCRAWADALVKSKEFDLDALSKSHVGEDRIFSKGGGGWHYKNLPQLKYPDYCDQARFCWNDASLDNRYNPYVALRAMTGSDVPMFLHKPTREIYDKLCKVDSAPIHIFVFSSATTQEDDYLTLVNSICPDQSKRLLVGLNECRVFRNTETGHRLFMNEERFLTIHNATVEDWVGPYAHFSHVGHALGPAWMNYRGRHDTLCVNWSPHEGLCSVTYDGEIPAKEWTEYLSTVRSAKDNAAPTMGYMTTRMMRLKYPNAIIHLVNFHGNANGFSVCYRHDVNWEYEEYSKDDHVRMHFTDVILGMNVKDI